MREKVSALPQELVAEARAAAAYLAGVCARHLSAEVERELSRRFGLSRREARSVIRHLVGTGELTYTYEHGCSFLECSYNRPVKIGERVVLAPADRPFRAVDEEVVVRIAPGGSFGSGRHPTTRLALRGLEQALGYSAPDRGLQRSAVLDIGTGSGVLVIAAVKLGVGRGLGIDTDPCARFEARRNVQRNRLAARIRVSDQTTEQIKPTGRFDFVLANLRLPTLARLAPTICDLTPPWGRLVLSGVRAEEVKPLLNAYRRNGFDALWTAEEKGWSTVVCERPHIGGCWPGQAGSLHPADGR
jgi:ribosomal protein L11 methyltransferase